MWARLGLPQDQKVGFSGCLEGIAPVGSWLGRGFRVLFRGADTTGALRAEDDFGRLNGAGGWWAGGHGGL